MVFLFPNIPKSKAKIFFAFLFFLSTLIYSQKLSIVENITENEGLNTNYIFQICEDHNGVLWLGTDKGLVKFDNGKWKVFDIDNGLPGNYINGILSNGKNGLFLVLSEQGFFFFDTNKNKITHKYSDGGNTFFNVQKSLNADYTIYYSNEKQIYYAIENNNVTKKHLLNLENGNLYLKRNGEKILLKKFQSAQNNPKIIFRNQELELVGGKEILRKTNGVIIDTIDERDGLQSNLIQDIYQSKDGDVYIATLGGGISILKKNNYKVAFDIENQKIRQIQYSKGLYYFISDGFLYVLNAKKVLSKIFLMKDALNFLIEGNKLYVGSFSGFYTYQLNQNSVKLISKKPLTVGISKIFKFQDRIYFTTYGNGVYDEDLNKITELLNHPFKNIENFFKINNGFAMNSYQSGFYITDEKFGNFKYFTKKNGLQSDYVSYVFSKGDLIFVGTKFGISVIKDNRVWKNLGQSNGFVGKIVREIFEDKRGQIWIVSDKAIMKLINNYLVSFGSLKSIGHSDDMITKSYFVAEKNQLCIATKNKFSIITLDDVEAKKTPPLPNLKKVLIDRKEHKFSQNIELSPDNFETEFQFASVYKNPVSEATLFYKFNDGDWKAFRDPTNLKFNHLEIGEYVLQFKTVNSDGYESILPGKIYIKVNDHFYKRWSFILLSILFVLGVIFYYINAYNKEKYKKKLEDLKLKQRLEMERRRISRDLHDNIGAYTTSLIAKVDDLKIKSENNEKLDDLRENAEHILGLLRQTIWILQNRETSIESFYDTFKNYASKYLKTHQKCKIVFQENIIKNKNLDSSVSLNLFRILQEALHNIIKHSEATIIHVELDSEEKIKFSIKDNGKGFEKNAAKIGCGLRNMEERAHEINYEFSIRTEVNKGTEIIIVEL